MKYVQHVRKVGNLRIQYKTGIVDETTKEVVVGKLRFRRKMDLETGKLTVSLGRLSIPVPLIFYSRRIKHYRNRLTMSEEEKEQLLVREAADTLKYQPNLRDPKTFNEKILWSKFHIHDPKMVECCDKYTVKDYVSRTIGSQYIVPTIASWEKAEDIDFDALPDQFVLKVNWESKMNIIVTDKNSIDREAIRQKISRWMEPWHNSYYIKFNWAYQFVKPVVYAEQYLEQVDGQLYDYKFFYNNGKFIYMFIAMDRQKELTVTYFDADFNYMPFTRAGRPEANPLPEMPKHLHEMIRLGAELAKPFQFVRVDFYEVGDAIYVGEMTFYTGGGILPFDPPEWDRKLGDMIELKEQL